MISATGSPASNVRSNSSRGVVSAQSMSVDEHRRESQVSRSQPQFKLKSQKRVAFRFFSIGSCTYIEQSRIHEERGDHRQWC